MDNYKFKVTQNVFIHQIKMSGVIKKCISKASANENIYEVEVNYQDRAWRAKFNESELSIIKEELP